MKVGIIGAGNIGKAIIDRIAGNDVNILVSGKNEEAYKGIRITADNKKVAQNSDAIILAVKPRSMSGILKQIKGYVNAKLVISVAAGLKIQFFESKLDAKIVRVMTNLAIKNGQGVSVYKLGNSCNLEDKKIVERILGHLGKCIEVNDENLLDVVTGISGSGIAYFIRIIDIFVESAESYGMDKKMAQDIILETVKGALSLMENGGHNHKGMICGIASKGGTTEQGLKELEEKDLDGILRGAITKTIEKCKLMGDKDG